MANSDKNIRITTSKNKTTYPNIVFTGSAAGSSVITLEVLDDNTLSFTSNEGQVFSIDSNLSTGTIWAVSDISGIPLLSSSAGGTIGLGVYGGIVAIGQTNPTYKLDLKGSFGLASSNDSAYNFIFSNSAASGSNSLQIRSANSILFYNSSNNFYTGFKSAATSNVTFTLPPDAGSSGQFLQTNGSGTLTWATATGGGGGSGATGVNPGGQYQIGYYASTGSSIDGSSTFTNNTSTNVVSISHSTASTNTANGALTVTGGVGIGGSLYVGGTGSSISGVRIASGAITVGAWNGTVIATQYGGTGQNLSSSSGILTISSGTVSASTTSSAILNALSDETGSGSLVFATSPVLVTPNIGAATGTSLYLSAVSPSTSVNTGAVIVPGGVGIGQSLSVGGYLQLFNTNNYTSFVSASTASTVYTLPPTSPATGSSVLQSTSAGVMSWVPMVASGGAGSGTVAIPDAQFRLAFYAGTGASVSSTSLITAVGTGVTILGATNASSTTAAALSVTGGLGVGGNAFIGGTIYAPSTSTSSISGINFANGIVTSGTWSGSTITAFYGGTGLQGPAAIGDLIVANTTSTWSRLTVGTTSGHVLTSNGSNSLPTWQAVPPAAASSVAVTPTTLNQSFFITTVSTSNGSGLGLSTITSFVVNPSTHIVSISGLAVTNNTASTSTATGALIVSGGFGLAGNAFIGGTIYAPSSTASNFSNLLVSNNTATTSTTSGALVVNGGLGIGGNAFIGGTIYVQSTTASNFSDLIVSDSTATTSTTSGALVVTGGLGLGGNAFIGGTVYVPSSTASNFSNLRVSNTTATTSTTSGALIVSGGLGLAGNAFIGGTIYAPSTSVNSISGINFANGIITSGAWSATAITAFYGGTGLQSPFAVGDILYATTTSTWGRLAASSTSGQVLTSNGANTLPTWQAVPPAAASSVAVTPTTLDQSFFVTTVSASNGSGLGLSTITSFVVNPFTNIVTISGLAVTASTQTTSSSTGALIVTNGAAVGQTLSVGGSLNIFNGANYTGFRFAGSANTTYTLPPRTPTGTGTSYLSSSIDGVLAWVAAPTSGGSGSVNSGTATYAAFYATTTNAVSENANLQFTGTGVSIGGRINSTSTTSGSVYVYGGLGVTGNAFIGGTAYIPSTIASNISNLLVSNNTSTTSTTSGALVVAGGLGLAGNAFIGSTVYVSSSTASNFSNLLVSNNTSSTSTSSGALAINGGIGIVGNAFIGGTVTQQNNTSSVGTNSGALTVVGGVGIAGNAFIGGTFVHQSSTSSVGTNSGSVTLAGGIGIAGNAFIGGTFVQQNNTSSVGTNSGALTVVGGVGIAGNAFIGGTFVHQSTTSSVGTNSGSVTLAGGIGIAGNAFIGGTTTIQSTQTSTSTISGALVVAGGVGIGGSLYTGLGFSSSISGVILANNSLTASARGTFSSSENSTTTSTGALVVTGGLGLGGSAFIGGTIYAPSATASNFSNLLVSNSTATTSTTSGALVIRGGAAVGSTLSIGGSLNIFNGSNYTGFRFAGSADTTYTLPPRTPTGTGTSYLSSSIDGVMAWVAAPSGGGSPGGTNLGDIQYKSGSTFAASTTFNYDENYSAVTISSFPLQATNSTVAAFKLLGTSQSWSGSTLGTFFAINAATGFVGDLINAQVNAASVLQLTGAGYLRLGAVGTGFTLPITNGSSGQVLTANTNGVASWTTVSGSSGAGSGTVAIPGAQYQVAAYYWSATGASVSGSSTFTNNTATGVVNITHATESTSSTTGALTVAGGAGIAKSLFVGTTLSVGQAAGYTIPNNLASFVSTVNSYNQLVIQNRSNGNAASANLVVNNDSSTDTTFYGEIGMNSSTFSGTGALAAPNATYVSATSGPLVLGTTTAHPIRFVVNGGASDVLYISEGGTAISCFVNFGLRSASDLRFWNSGNTFYAGIQGGNTSASYLLSMPTAQVGAGASAIITGSDGQMYFVAPGSGIAFSAVNANTPALRVKRAITLQFAAGYTPLAAGPDNVILKIPQAVDGVSTTTYQLRELDIRVETPSAGTSRIQLEKYTGTTAFTLGGGLGLSMIGGFGITLTGAAIHTTSISFASGILTTTNDKLRLNWTLLNATHANFSIQLTMEEL